MHGSGCAAGISDRTTQEVDMKRSFRKDVLVAAGVFLAASAAPLSPAVSADMPSVAARGDDAAYCAALTKQYHQYIDETVGQGGPSSAAGGSLAMAQCAAGNTKDGIPVLERKLSNAKISLPQRSLAPPLGPVVGMPAGVDRQQRPLQ